jgi:ribosomal protein S8
MFPTIAYNYAISYVINAVSLATAHKKLFIKIVYTKRTLSFIKLLKSVNYVGNFYIFKKNNTFYIRVVPFYFKNTKPVHKFRLLSKPTRAYSVSLRALYLLNKRSGAAIYLLSTSQGCMTHIQAINRGLSGHMIGYFLM